jgi:hypothetical protein
MVHARQIIDSRHKKRRQKNKKKPSKSMLKADILLGRLLAPLGP